MNEPITPSPAFSPVDSTLFFTRNDPNDVRLGDLAKALPPLNDSRELTASLEEGQNSLGSDLRHYVLAGYPDDEGISINGGRVGASRAPDSVRKPLYKMTPNLLNSRDRISTPFALWDIGNLSIQGGDLLKRHERVTDFAVAALQSGARWIGLGGGHDYGFPDAAAYVEWFRAQPALKGQRPLVINFDAHLDVRPTTRGISSGTPFFRMLEAYPDVDFAEIGIQTQCNSKSHLEWVLARGARVLTQEEVEASGESFSTMVLRKLGDWILKPRPVFLSIDIDGFSSSVAPGCSQSWATGFLPQEFFPCLQVLARRLDVRVLGIYEVSPPLDQDDRTSKLAAQIVHRILDPL